mmetsp:Transcript_11001/g.19620  ORF Transcript_11001/g.19620 Transcript_11001/m.19620 type:complete len:200 (-) Transcript_11001:818-1417(-)
MVLGSRRESGSDSGVAGESEPVLLRLIAFSTASEADMIIATPALVTCCEGAVTSRELRRTNSGLDMKSSAGVSPKRRPMRVPFLKSALMLSNFSLRCCPTSGSTCFRERDACSLALRTASLRLSCVSSRLRSRSGFAAANIHGCSKASSAVMRFFIFGCRQHAKKATVSLESLKDLLCHLILAVSTLMAISLVLFASKG